MKPAPAPQAGKPPAAPAVVLDPLDKEVRSAWQAVRDATFSGKPGDASKVAASGEAFRKLLTRENALPYRPIAGELIGYTVARAWLNQNDFERAGEAFSDEITAQHSAATSFLNHTHNPCSFAQDVFVLHSEIIAHTEQEIGNTDYLVFPVGGGPTRSFVFIHSTDETLDKGAPVAGLDPGLQRRMIYVTSPGPQGRYRVSDRAQVIGDCTTFSANLRFDPVSKPYLTLDGVKRVVQYSGANGSVPVVYDSGLPKIHLRIDGGKIEQPFVALARMDMQPTHVVELPPMLGPVRPAMLASSGGPAPAARSNAPVPAANPAASGSITANVAAATKPASSSAPGLGVANGVDLDGPAPARESTPATKAPENGPGSLLPGLDVGSSGPKRASSDRQRDRDDNEDGKSTDSGMPSRSPRT